MQVGNHLVGGNGCCQHVVVLHAGGLGDCGEIQAAADVCAGKYSGQFRFVRTQIKENYADDSSCNYCCTPNNESNQRRTGFPDNALEVRFKQ